jgi:hypothetical protein
LAQLKAAIEWARDSGEVAILARLEAYEGNLRHDEAQLQRALAQAEALGDARLLGFVESYYAGYLGQEGRCETSRSSTLPARSRFSAQRESATNRPGPRSARAAATAPAPVVSPNRCTMPLRPARSPMSWVTPGYARGA